MNRVFNFSSGPAMLPTDVLEQIQKEFRNWNGLGTSIIEVSHRSEDFLCLIKEAKKNLRDLLNIPSNYKILFCHGGGRGQFSAIPLNLLGNKTKADYVSVGFWSESAVKEARKYCIPNIIDAKFIFEGKLGVKPMNEWKISFDAAYVHYCPNETIDGIAIYESPNFSNEIIITADFSSCILSSPLDINQFGVIYASAQKNIGPSGLTLVIVRDNLLGMSSRFCPSIMDYTTLSESEPMYNTPSTFSLYVANLFFNWLRKKGGVMEISLVNQQKATLLYNVIDNSELYQNNIVKYNRSKMNVPFQLTNKKLEGVFLRESSDAGLYALKGHRVAGGMRASIYNAMPLEGVRTLAEFMIDFEYRYG